MTRRSGFTLIELLITMALIMLIMAILSTSFIVGLDTFGKLKALGDMSERLRAATTLLRRDLDADHFEGRIRLSDPALVSASVFHRPREGFVRVRQVQPSIMEGHSEGVPSYRGALHVLHMAVKLRGNRPEDFFSAQVPPGSPLLQPNVAFFSQPTDGRYQDGSSVYKCQWAEVAYYTHQLPNQWTANGTPLYSLHRVTRLCVVDNRGANAANVGAHQLYTDGISVQPNSNPLKFNSPRDLANPPSRSIGLTNPPMTVDTILLTDVVSFDIKILKAPLFRRRKGLNPLHLVIQLAMPPIGQRQRSRMFPITTAPAPSSRCWRSRSPCASGI